MIVPTVAAGSDDCSMEREHARLASVWVRDHCMEPQMPRSMDFSLSVMAASRILRLAGLISARSMLST